MLATAAALAILACACAALGHRLGDTHGGWLLGLAAAICALATLVLAVQVVP